MSEELTDGGPNRRDVLKRGALVGGALVWTIPAVQTIAAPAFAASSPVQGGCRYTFTYTSGTDTACFAYASSDPAKCRAFEAFYCAPFGLSGNPAQPFSGAGQNAVIAFGFALATDPGGIDPAGFQCGAPLSAPNCAA